MRLQERSCEWQWSDTTDTGKSHDKVNMMDVAQTNYIHTVNLAYT